MSWLGVNLNDGLNSIKGQLSTITRSVLSEDLEDLDGDDEGQVIVPRDRIKELEALCQLQKHELDEGRRAREEMEERLQAGHLATAHQTYALRSQLQHTQTELQELRERTSEWGWDAGEGGSGGTDTSTTNNHQKLQHQQQYQQQEFTRQEQLNQQLSRRVEELEGELDSLRHTGQHQTTGFSVGDGGEGKEDTPASSTLHENQTENGEAENDEQFIGKVKVREVQRDNYRNKFINLQKEFHRVAKECEDYDKKAREVSQRCEELESQNQHLVKSLEELDTQHQAVIDQILKKKNQALEEGQAIRESHREVTQLLAQTQADKEQQDKQLQELLSQKQHQDEQLQQLQAHKNKMEEQVSSLQAELSALKSQSFSHHDQRDTVQRLEKEKEDLHSSHGKMKNELKMVREREQLQCSLLEDKNKLHEELTELQKKYEEEHTSKIELNRSMENMKMELDSVRQSKAEIAQSYEQSEEHKSSALNKVANLDQQLSILTEQMSQISIAKNSSQEEESQVKSLKEKLSATESKKSKAEAELRNLRRSLEDEVEALKEKLSVAESEKSSTEQDQRDLHSSLDDAMANSEILESRLQAKSQEFEMAKTSLNDLEARLRLSDGELAALRRAKVQELDELKKVLNSHNQSVEGVNDDGGAVSVGRVVSEAVWQRDTLEHHVASLTHQLREKTDLLADAEMARSEAERECEDLRDQLEEIQKGERPPPEGSCRGLPTIEEEEPEGGEAEGAEAVENKAQQQQPQQLQQQLEKVIEVQEVREVNQGGDEPQRSGEIHALHAQVEALSEARGNLETEVASLRGEREGLIGQLRQAEGRTGNLVNLETEAAALRGQKQSLEMQLETLSQEMDLATVTLQDERDTVREQVVGLAHRLEAMQADMTLQQHERESIGQQLLIQYAAVEEKDTTIRLLEGELHRLKSTLREKFTSSTENTEAKLQGELDSVKSQIIYKEDKIDALTQTIEQFAEIFELKDCTGKIDEMFRQIKGKYSALGTAVEEKEEKIKELTKLIDNLREEFESSKKQMIETGAREMSEMTEKEKELSLAKEQVEKSDMEVFQLRERVEEIMGDVNGKEENIQKLLKEIEALKACENETNVKLRQLKEDLVKAQDILDRETRMVKQLQEENEELASKEQRTLQELSMVGSEKDRILQEKQERLSLLQSQVEALEREKLEVLSSTSNEKGSIKAEYEKLLQEKNRLVEKLEEAETKRNGAEASKQTAEARVKELEAGVEAAESRRREAEERCQTIESRLKEAEAGIEAAEVKTKEAEARYEAANLRLKESETVEVRLKELEAERLVAENQSEALQGERNQLIATITQKHQESVAYHGEIQRLSQVLTQEREQRSCEQIKLSSELRESEEGLTEARAQVSTLREQLHAVSNTNSELQKNAAQTIVHKTEVAGLRKDIEGLRTKLSSMEGERDQLRVANSHFNTQYQDQAKELSTVKERESRLSTECERLRQHLVGVEETYTGEALRAEEREATLRATLNKMEEKLANHSNFYTTAKERASVQVETLLEEVREMTAQRDDSVFRLHAAEETANTTHQSLSTLQQVLEDFQKNQGREIKEATERMRRQLEEEQSRSNSISTQLNALKGQLGEAQGGLAAAGRLGEQLTRKEQMITALRAQVTSQEEVARRSRDEMALLKTSTQGKVEKQLLRNLLVGYFATPGDKRSEVLRVIGEVLDFSGEERARTGLDTQGSSWLSSIANFLAPPASNVVVTSKVDVLDHTSLSQAFIRFLEDESNPRPKARLPAVQMAQQTTEKAEKKAQAKAQAANKIFVSTAATPTTTSSESGTSSPLLAAASTTPTLPTIATTTVPSTPVPTVSTTLPSTTAPTISTNKYLSNLLTSPKDDENANKPLG